MVAASNSSDAAALLIDAVRDDDPVLYLEHRGLYFRTDEPPPSGTTPGMQAARIVRPGDDVTIITYSKLVWDAIEAAAQLEKHNISAEIVDLRSLVPLDMATVIGSVKRTNRALIAHEAVMIGGLGAEIAARIQEQAFDWLDAPVARLGAPFTPVPASPVLEDAFVPNTDSIVEMVLQMLV
jgi:pyruvate dehydrogenase E1 component beta subunit